MVGEGSGFIISSDGLIVTNYHVAGEADKINVTLKDGTVYKATLKGADKKTDLALIKIDAKKPLPYVAFGDSGKVRPGDKVLAVGNPFGLGGTVTAGIVSAVGREIGEGPYDDFIQVDAPINRGNSGGPTFDMRGNVIGVNTAIFSPSGGSVGIGFAIASNQAKQIVNQLMEHGTVDRGFLGVSIQPIDPDLAKALKLDDTHGALVSKVEPDSPAAKAGVKSRDVILQFDGKEVEKPSQLSRYVAGTQAGKSSELVLWRDGKRETLQVDVGKMPSKETASNEQGGDQPDENQPKLGLSLAPLDARHARPAQPRPEGRGRGGDPGPAGQPGRPEGHPARRHHHERQPEGGQRPAPGAGRGQEGPRGRRPDGPDAADARRPADLRGRAARGVLSRDDRAGGAGDAAGPGSGRLRAARSPALSG